MSDPHAAVTAAERRLRRVYLAAMSWLRDRHTVGEVEEMIRAGRTADVIAEVSAAADRIAAEASALYLDAAQVQASALGAAAGTLAHHDPVDAATVAALQLAADRLSSDLAADQDMTARIVVADAVATGATAAVQAERLQASIGLSPTQAQSVIRYRLALEAGSVTALAHRLRDRRRDTTVARAADGAVGFTPQEIERMVAGMNSRALVDRARAFGEQEGTATVYGAGYDALRQTIDAGTIRASDVTRTWWTREDHKVRDSHETMQRQERGGVTAFESGDGNALRYPGDPAAPLSETRGCRCRTSIVVASAASKRLAHG